MPFMLLVQLGSSGCFNSDEKVRSSDEIGSESSETNAMYSDETSPSTDDNWTAEETAPGETTCRDAIDCLVMCQAFLLLNPEPEPDLSCFLECDQGLSIDEAYALLKLGECIATQCTEVEGQCGGSSEETDGTETGPTDEDCLLCIAAYATDPQPPGCEAEAAACD